MHLAQAGFINEGIKLLTIKNESHLPGNPGSGRTFHADKRVARIKDIQTVRQKVNLGIIKLLYLGKFILEKQYLKKIFRLH